MATLSALPVHPRSWAALLERDDVVLDQGVLRLRHHSTTPDVARIDDLLLTADALETAGVPVLLVRHDVRIPALVVDVRDAAAAVAALRTVPEPLYVKRKASVAVLAAELEEPSAAPSSMRVYRPRISEAGDLRYDHEIGIRVEFWRFGERVIDAPHDNAVTRRQTPTADVEFTDVERHGRSWRTISGMFDVHPAEFTEDVDMVFSWVDGSSSEFQRQRAAQLAEYVVGEGDDGPARFRHVDELRYALRSVHMYAPWVRRIFIATDSPAPAWLADHPKVTVVRSEEFFADTSVLPIHNSHAVETQLHRIEGLAEHFLYSNDDMFFGRPVEPELFFSPPDSPASWSAACGSAPAPPRCTAAATTTPCGSTARCCESASGAPSRETSSTARRRCAAASWPNSSWPSRRTSPGRRHPASARRPTSPSPTACTTTTPSSPGEPSRRRAPRVRYVQTTLAASLAGMERLARRRDVDMFCLNDGGAGEMPEELRVRTVTDILERMFPVRAPWERAEVSAGRESAPSAERSSVG